MRVLALLGVAGSGGHTRSAITIARELAARGEAVSVYGGDYGGAHLLSASGLPWATWPGGDSRGFPITSAAVWAVTDRMAHLKPEVVHAFDDRAVALGAIACARLQSSARLVWTSCGGRVGRSPIIRMRPTVVFSAEQRAGFISRHGLPDSWVDVQPARIDLAAESHSSAPPAPRLRELVGFTVDDPIVLLISRIASNKAASLRFFAKAATTWQGPAAQFVIVGSVADPGLGAELVEIARQSQLGDRARLWITSRESAVAARLLPSATIAVGVGRTAFEAMALGIPTAVVGEQGFSGFASEDSVCDRMQEFNFSGRDSRALASHETSVEAFQGEVTRMLLDREHAAEVGAAGQRWVRKTMDVAAAGTYYQALYRREAEAFVRPKWYDVARLVAYTRVLNTALRAGETVGRVRAAVRGKWARDSSRVKRRS